MALADDGSPVFVARGMNTFASMFLDMPKIAEAFRGDGALSWGDHHPCLFCGTEWFFRTGYRAHLTDRVDPRARRRRRPAQGGRARRRRRVRPWRVGGGDGRGVSRTRSSPGSTSTRRRSRRAASGPREAGVGGRVDFEVATATGYAGRIRPDLLLRLPARHGRPGRRRPARARAPAARRHGACSSSRSPSTPRPRNIAENPMAALFYVASSCVCTPNSLSQEVGVGLGAQAGEAKLRDDLRGGRLPPLPARRPDADEPHHRGQGVSRSAPSVGSGDRSMRRPGPCARRLPGPPDAGAVPGGLGQRRDRRIGWREGRWWSFSQRAAA